MTTTKPIPEEIRDYIDYEPETGVCVWKKVRSNRIKVGDPAGSKQSDGYLKVRFGYQLYFLHRIIWYLYYGEDLGDMVVDHMNGVTSDNRISNLRLVTNQENQHNTKHLGVSYHKPRSKWRAQIQVDGKKIHLGLFDCPLLAGLAYQDAKKQLHPTAVR